MLSKGDNAFNYISKDDNVFSHLCFQKATMPSFSFQKTTMSSVIYAFKRRQCLQSFMLSKGGNGFIYISKDDNVFSHLRFQRRQCLCFIGLGVLYVFKKKEKNKRTSMSSCFVDFTLLAFASCLIE